MKELLSTMSIWKLMLIISVFIHHTLAGLEKGTLEHIWDITKAFNGEFNFRSWVIHYDKDSEAIARTVKKNDFMQSDESEHLRYDMTGFNDVTKTSHILPDSQRRLHLYLAEDFQYLKSLLPELQKPHDVESFEYNPSKPSHRNFADIFLIYIPTATITNGTSIADLFNALPLRLDSMAFVFYESAEESNGLRYEIKDLYKVGRNSKEVEMVPYAEWTPLEGMRVAEKRIWKRRSNLKGYQIKISSAWWPPSQTLVKDGCTNPSCFEGYYADLFHGIQSATNFTYIIKNEDTAGAKLDNGSWSGQIGMAVNGIVDIAVDDFGYTKERAEVVDFISFGAPNYGKIYIRNPRETFDWEAYTGPLRKEAWIGVGIFCIITPFLIMIVGLEPYGSDTPGWSLVDSFVIVYKSILMLGANVNTDSLNKRISYLTILFAGILLYWLWEAQLISYFSFPSKSLPFNNLAEFLEKSDNKLIVLKGSMHEDHFKYSKDPIRKRIYDERIKPNIDEPPYNTGFCQMFNAMMEDPSYAVYAMFNKGGEKDCQNEGVMSFYNCEIIAVPYVVDTSMGGGWAFPKNSEFFAIFKNYGYLMDEVGSYNRIKAVYEPPGETQLCTEYDGNPIGIHKCFSLFGLLCLGAGLSIIVFMFELMLSCNGISNASSVLENFTPNNVFERLGCQIMTRDDQKLTKITNGTQEEKRIL